MSSKLYIQLNIKLSESKTNIYSTVTDCICLEAKLTNILSLQQSDINNSTYISLLKASSKWMSLLSDDMLENLGNYIQQNIHTTNSIVKQSHAYFDNIIYIKSGKIIKVCYDQSNKDLITNIETMNEGSILGERELFHNINPKYALIVDSPQTVILTLSTNILKIFLSKQLIDFIKNEIFVSKIKEEVDLSNSHLIAHLGKGSYGCVNLINYKDRLYALKTMTKSKYKSKPSTINYLVNEKVNLMSLNSPFIMKLKTTLTDEYFCHFVTEFIYGLPLDEIVRKKQVYHKSKVCLFYFYNLILILESCRHQRIVHRDIKPANIILQKNGYLKLIDFGLSRKLKDFTYTIIGSPFFIAPEVLKGYGYGRSCDYWAVGITLYKLYFSKYPFGEACNTALEVYREINESKLTFPYINDKDSNSIRSVLKIMLDKTAASRPCSLKEVATHITDELKWSELVNMTMEPPIFPNTDLSNYQYFNPDDKLLLSKANIALINMQGLKFKPNLIFEKLQPEKIGNLPKSGDLFDGF